MSRASAPWLTTASLQANRVMRSPEPRTTSTRRRMRSSSGSSPASARSIASVRVGRRARGEEAEVPEVDAEDRHLAIGDQRAAVQQRAVAAEHDQQIDRLLELVVIDEARAVRRRLVTADDDRLVPARAQPRRQLVGDLDAPRAWPA